MKLFTTRSTKKFEDHRQVRKLHEEYPDHVIAIGGGGIIDKAKLYCKKNKKKLIAIPTTGAGASETDHAVIWNAGRKCSSKCEQPLSVMPEFEVKLRKRDRENTIWDVYAHFLESAEGKATPLGESVLCIIKAEMFKAVNWSLLDKAIIEQGMIAGRMIQQYGTNLYHALSYPLTAIYGVPHGRALKYVLTKLPHRFTQKDRDHIITEALTYTKIHKSRYGEMTEQKLKGFLK